jgi:hypothetical protein
MGQYYVVVNLDKRQYIHPHKLGDGLKLLEFGASGCGTMTALALLLADGNGRGGGDLYLPDDCPPDVAAVVGSWAGDRIVVAGDYADCGRWIPADTDKETLAATARAKYTEGYQTPEHVTLQAMAEETFEDISAKVTEVMLADEYLREQATLRHFLGRVPREANYKTPLTWIDTDCRWAVEGENTYADGKKHGQLRPDIVVCK